MAHKIGSTIAQTGAPAPECPRSKELWALVAPEVERVVADGHKATRWRRAHPGTSAHIKMARTVAKQESAAAMGALRAVLLDQAPAHWDLGGWGFSVAANLRDARWDQRGGKGRASWSNHLAVNSATSVALFLGRILAAFDLARQADTTDRAASLFRFALPETHRATLGLGVETTWRFSAPSISGQGADDAFANAAFLGVFAKASARATAEASFLHAYHHTIEQRALAVPTRGPELTKRLLAHPKAKLLMAAQIDPNDSRTLEVFQHVVAQRTTVEPNPQLTTRHQTLEAAQAMETLLEGTLDVLNGLGKPSQLSGKPNSWRVWSSKRGGIHQRVWAWDLASASAIATIDDLQMVKDAINPARYATLLASNL
jgi:hypothetical protein